jgi:hypothetical protein
MKRIGEIPDPPVPFSLPYKGERLRWALQVLGWTKFTLAKRLEMMNSGSISQMLLNHCYIPEPLALWIEEAAALALAGAQAEKRWEVKQANQALFAFHRDNPKPPGWLPKPTPEVARERLEAQKSQRSEAKNPLETGH